MRPLQVLPSTTSHKHEPLVPTLELFARLGLLDLDLNLNHIVERGEPLGAVQRALAANGQRVRIVSGGWCDFFDDAPRIEETFASVARQVALARELGAGRLRLFFGRLPRDRWSTAACALVAANLRRLADGCANIEFVLENHDGASSDPVVCRAILESANRPNLRMTFDPINFEHRGADSLEAARALQPWIAHVHLKGLDRTGFCEFGAGDIDLTPVLELLIAKGYAGAFTVEYEGAADRTLRLWTGWRNAERTIDRLRARPR